MIRTFGARNVLSLAYLLNVQTLCLFGSIGVAEQMSAISRGVDAGQKPKKEYNMIEFTDKRYNMAPFIFVQTKLQGYYVVEHLEIECVELSRIISIIQKQ